MCECVTEMLTFGDAIMSEDEAEMMNDCPAMKEAMDK